MDRGEIISRIERRRRWTPEQKVGILAEALRPGATVSAVADRSGISRSQIYYWKRLAREGRLPGVSLALPAKPLFAPVRIENGPAPPLGISAPPPATSVQRRTGIVEIALRNGRVVRVEDGIEPGRLTCLIAALEGPPS
jgi:transposase